MRVKWISVKERLPEYGDDVLIVCSCSDYEEVFVGYRAHTDAGGEHFRRLGSNKDMYGVTHWVSLPALPCRKGE